MENPLEKRTSRNASMSSTRTQGTAAAAASQSPPIVDKPWFTEGYWSKDPSTAAARRIYIKILSLSAFLIIITILSIMSIYWGALWKTTALVHNLKGWIVDFDGGDLGAAIIQGALSKEGDPSQMTWEVVPTSQFPEGQPQIIDAIKQDKTWVIISINPGASITLNAAAATIDTSYNASLAITAYANEARSENAYRDSIHENIVNVLDKATANFNAQFVRGLALSGTNVTAIAEAMPTLLSQPSFYTVNNVIPFDVAVAAALNFVGLIYLLILAFVMALANYAARVDITHIEDRLTFRALMLMRIFNPIICYFFISLFYGLLSVAFQVPLNRTFGHSGFFVYWMISWFAMIALGFSVEAMITLLTPRFVPYFLLLSIISNVSVCYFPPQLLPGVYRYAYAMPFYNVQQAVRTIIFGTRNQMGLNFGVQLAWILVSLMTITLFQYYKRRQAILAHQRTLAVSEKSNAV